MSSDLYKDIINLPHHQSEKRPHMSLDARAAQFAPFAALTGYEDIISETARLTDSKFELTEPQKALLDTQLQLLITKLKERPEISVEYFIPDPMKSGGMYTMYTGNIRLIDIIEKRMIFTDGFELDFDDIFTLTGEVLNISNISD